MRSVDGSISRAQFLRGDLRGRQAPIRPPWSLSEAEIDEICTRCNECLSACPEQIISHGRDHLPVVDFSKGACTFCGKCVAHCKPQALLRTDGSQPWDLKAVLAGNCLAKRGVMCRSCGDVCELRAIHFKLAVGGFAHPEFDNNRCSGCGACVAPCPVQAISVYSPANVPVSRERRKVQ